MNEHLLLLVIACLLSTLALRHGFKTTLLISLGLTGGLFLAWWGSPALKSWGVTLYMASALFSGIEILVRKKQSYEFTFAISSMGFLVFFYYLHKMMGWSFRIELMMIIPGIVIALYGLLLNKKVYRRKEFEYTTLMFVDMVLLWV